MKRIPLTPLLLAFLALAQSANAQVTTGSNTPGPGVQYLGWNNSGTQKDLDITNNWQLRDINFTTNDGTTTAIRVKLQDDGNLGIGLTNPAELLDVNGNINIATGQWYGIDGDRILANEGANSIFLGFRAGAVNTGSSCTFLGVDAGRNNTGNNAIAIGFNAGENNTGANAIYVGGFAGDNATGSRFNCIDYSYR